MSKIKFITDSAADIPQELAAAHPDLQVLPFTIYMNGREYRDCVDFTQQEFYRELVAAPVIPTHSQINPSTIEDCYRDAWQAGYTDLIYTSINAKGSATCQNAIMAVDTFFEDYPEAKGAMEIQVIDSTIYTYVYGYAVLEAVKLAENGGTAQQCADLIRDWCAHARVLFAPYDLKFAKKSGRVSAAAAFLGEALGLKPIMTFEDGASKVLSKVRGERNIIPTILQMAAAEIDPAYPYVCIYGSLDAENEKLTAGATETLGYPPLQSFYIGGVIAINAGPNLVGVFYRKRD